METFTTRIHYLMHDDRTDEPYLYMISGDRLTLKIDAGNAPEATISFQKELQQAGFQKPDLAVLTHWHWDHTFGLDAMQCPVIASSLTDRKLKEVMTWKWDEESMQKRLKTGEDIPFCDEHIRVQYPDLSAIHVRHADVTFAGDLSIDLGGGTAILEQRDSPHTRDSVFIRIPEEGVLIGGDAEYPDYYDYDSKYDPERLAFFIHYLEVTEFDTYLRGHDEAAVSKADLLRQMKEIAEQG